MTTTYAYADTSFGYRRITEITDYLPDGNIAAVLDGWRYQVPVPADRVRVHEVKTSDCEYCDGEGYLIHDHPLWGHLECPEPTVEEECGACRGTGLAIEILR